ncbi:MAG: class I SAM-dependent methyltransferase [Patescibacteria group bacterium]
MNISATNSYSIAYDSKRRFASYWHQIREIISHEPQHVLEVGMGNGFVSRYVKGHGVRLTTVDIDQSLKPDVVADVAHLPFPDASYDVVTAYEVLEHMPYEKTLQGLHELFRVSSQWVIISLPDATHAFRFAVTIPRVGYIEKVFSPPFVRAKKKPYAKSHEWEIGIQGYPMEKITSDCKKIGLQLLKTYRVYENPYHRFFVFKKN